MSNKKLAQAKKLFDSAAKHGGDAAHTINETAKGLSMLAEALIELRADIDAIKSATAKRHIKRRA